MDCLYVNPKESFFGLTKEAQVPDLLQFMVDQNNKHKVHMILPVHTCSESIGRHL